VGRVIRHLPRFRRERARRIGRYMIALAMKAAYERVATQDRPPAFLFIDEAAEYFDENIEILLSQARKFNLGIVVAHQHMDQLSTELRSSLAANTSIKMAGGVSDRDAHALAPDMRTTADFITSMGKHQRSTEFACYVRNYTANAVRLQIPFLSLETETKMSTENHKALTARNRQRVAPEPVAAVKPEAAQQATEPKPKPPSSNDADSGPTDASGNW
jgi:hypothetical protein